MSRTVTSGCTTRLPQSTHRSRSCCGPHTRRARGHASSGCAACAGRDYMAELSRSVSAATRTSAAPTGLTEKIFGGLVFRVPGERVLQGPPRLVLLTRSVEFLAVQVDALGKQATDARAARVVAQRAAKPVLVAGGVADDRVRHGRLAVQVEHRLESG